MLVHSLEHLLQVNLQRIFELRVAHLIVLQVNLDKFIRPLQRLIQVDLELIDELAKQLLFEVDVILVFEVEAFEIQGCLL